MIIDDIALTLEKGVDHKTTAHLIECFGSAQEIYSASAERLIDVAELKPQIAQQIVRRSKHEQAQKEVKHIEKYGISAISATSPEYPYLLKECCDNPHVLYLKGDVSILNAPILTMVGTREITQYGLRVCDSLIKDLAEQMPDLVIASGLAYGVDVACHRAALRYGLRTMAVLATTLPAIYPAHHANVADEIIRSGGAIVSELNTTATYHKGQFLQRNRILAGIAGGTVVVESKKRGGSLNTAAVAESYNRVVMAVPGRTEDKSSQGTNNLIRSLKARIVSSAEQISEEMGWPFDEKQRSDEAGLSGGEFTREQTAVMSSLSGGETLSVDGIIERTGLDTGTVMSTLLTLEIDGLVKKSNGVLYERFM